MSIFRPRFSSGGGGAVSLSARACCSVFSVSVGTVVLFTVKPLGTASAPEMFCISMIALLQRRAVLYCALHCIHTAIEWSLLSTEDLRSAKRLSMVIREVCLRSPLRRSSHRLSPFLLSPGIFGAIHVLPIDPSYQYTAILVLYQYIFIMTGAVIYPARVFQGQRSKNFR